MKGDELEIAIEPLPKEGGVLAAIRGIQTLPPGLTVGLDGLLGLG